MGQEELVPSLQDHIKTLELEVQYENHQKNMVKKRLRRLIRKELGLGGPNRNQDE